MKSFFPRSLFGRSLIILLVPIVVLQLVVGTIFFQRHYQRVTEQMTENFATGLGYMIRTADAMPGASEVSQWLTQISTPLGLVVRLEPGSVVFPGASRDFYDLSGGTIANTLEERIHVPVYVDLSTDSREAFIQAQTEHGILDVTVERSRLSVSNPHQLLVLMVTAAVLLATIGIIFLRNQIRPIWRLAEASDAFGKGRSIAFKPVGAEEVRRAGRAFISMRNRIERQNEQRMQTLSGISHDLRTPLTRMRLTLALMDESEETKDLMEDVGQMERLIREFLDFARSDATEATETVDALELGKSISFQAERSGHTSDYLVQDVSGGNSMVQLRPVAVSRAVLNLTSNAVRFADRSSLTLRLTQRNLTFIVDDNGPGIPQDVREEALQPFSRLDAARNQDQGVNVGLGLSIAMDVARSHGGNLVLTRSATLGGLRAELQIPR
ncbi:MAG: ATP-binding protein [Pseudomonadota bacterium]